MTKFVNTDIEKILDEYISRYQKKTGQSLSPASAERIILDTMAYRELLLRGEMNGAMTQNFVQTATGEALNMWGGLFGCTRSENEDDNKYRERILAQNKGSLGTYNAYLSRLKSISDIVDVQIQNRFSNSNIAPGVILYSALQKGDGEVVTPDEEHITMMNESIYDPSFGLLGIDALFMPPTAVSINGMVTIKKYVLTDTEIVKRNVELRIKMYFDQLSQEFQAKFLDIDKANFIELLSEVDGVNSVSCELQTPILKVFEYYKKGNITIKIS